MHASGAVFAAGNGIFLLLMFGRKALLLLWLFFAAAFALPRRGDLGDWLRDSTGGRLGPLLDLVETAFEAIRERGGSLVEMIG